MLSNKKFFQQEGNGFNICSFHTIYYKKSFMSQKNTIFFYFLQEYTIDIFRQEKM